MPLVLQSHVISSGTGPDEPLAPPPAGGADRGTWCKIRGKSPDLSRFTGGDALPGGTVARGVTHAGGAM
jgi:hypothetical protein